MDLAAFRATLSLPAPPGELSLALQALWRDANGDWDGAHVAAQADEGGDGDWVHAYLHRKEGDDGNARYWYRRAGKPIARLTLAEEWEAIARALISAGRSQNQRNGETPMDAAYEPLGPGHYRASPLTGGPWHRDHQHAGPPSALIAREIERAAAPHGLTHLGRLTVNLLRPLAIGECELSVSADYVGRSSGHFSGRLTSQNKTIALFTALVQREQEFVIPEATPGHPLPGAPRSADESPAVSLDFGADGFGYTELVETRLAAGKFFAGPCAVWFRLNHPLVKGEPPSPYQRVAVAADSGNGISAALDIHHYQFVNCDLTINLLRRPVGEWILLDAQSLIGGNGCGLAESALYDEVGLIGQATQSLAVRKR